MGLVTTVHILKTQNKKINMKYNNKEEGDVCGVCGNDMVYGESCNCINE